MKINHICKECNSKSEVTVNFNITDVEIQIAQRQHCDWANGTIGKVCCPYCKIENFVIIQSEWILRIY